MRASGKRASPQNVGYDAGPLSAADITAPLRRQIEQLQRRPPVISSAPKVNDTAPQWQLP